MVGKLVKRHWPPVTNYEWLFPVKIFHSGIIHHSSRNFRLNDNFIINCAIMICSYFWNNISKISGYNSIAQQSPIILKFGGFFHKCR